MPRMYSIIFSGVTVTAQQDLIEATAAAGKPFSIHQVNISQSSETGDAAEEGLSILIKTGQTASGSGGTSYIPAPRCVNDAAAGIAAEVNNTTKASGGTIVTHVADNWNIRSPYIHFPTPEDRIIVAGGERCTVELATTPADAITMSGWMLCEELS